jgi:hypothetical protein
MGERRNGGPTLSNNLCDEGVCPALSCVGCQRAQGACHHSLCGMRRGEKPRKIANIFASPYDIQTLPRWVGQVVVINDMIFDSLDRGTRFAVGTARVFFTLNGKAWKRLLSISALPGYPVAAYFDRLSNPFNRVLYVAMNGRGLLHLSPGPSWSQSMFQRDLWRLCHRNRSVMRPRSWSTAMEKCRRKSIPNKPRLAS